MATPKTSNTERPFRVRPSREDDLSSVQALLDGAGLPMDGVAEHFAQFVVAEDESTILGAAGLEIYEDQGLLRSVVVSPSARGRGIGATLVLRTIERARAAKASDIYLLTTTAAEYFERLGFVRVDRARAPAALAQSAEFKGACPASATFMRKDLEGLP